MSETGGQSPNPAPEPADDRIQDAEITPELGADAQPAGEPDARAAAAALADRVNALEAELAEAKDERLRAMAEAENARRRGQKDREEANRYGAAHLARDVVSVADNLARAVAAMPEAIDDPAVKSLAEGVAMVEKELAGALEKHGVKAVGAVGEAFDPNTCQAMFEVETNDLPAGAVAQVMQRGYVLHERLLRPAMVGVAKAPAGGAPDGDGRGGQVDETA